MNEQLERMKLFLSNLGAAWLPHAGQSYVDHLTAVYHGLKCWGYNEYVCDAGFFHSIYGTERFTAFKVPLSERPTIRGIIGARAEKTAYLNCTMERAEFDAFVLSRAMVAPLDRELLAVHLADWLDQVPFCKEWGYRREVYRSIADQLGPEELATFEWVYRGR